MVTVASEKSERVMLVEVVLPSLPTHDQNGKKRLFWGHSDVVIPRKAETSHDALTGARDEPTTGKSGARGRFEAKSGGICFIRAYRSTTLRRKKKAPKNWRPSLIMVAGAGS